MKRQSAASIIGVSFGLALAACAALDAGGSASPNYQAPATAVAPPANLRAVCYDEAGLSAYRVRMVQQQLNVGTLACKNSDGSRKLDKQYTDFVHKFNSELKTNAIELKKVATHKKVNFDVLLTEIANRTAQRPAKDAEFCSRQQRALEWALAPQVSSLTEVPAPYDLGPEMKIFPCPKG